MGKHNGKACGVCRVPTLQRNNYFHGKLMTVRDYLAEQKYFNEKRWLVNRMVNGWGVVCGLDVALAAEEDAHVCVSPGMAIDNCGREITVCDAQTVPLEWGVSECEKGEEKPEGEEKRIICLFHRECKSEPLELLPVGCDLKEACEYNRIMDSFAIRSIPYEAPEGPEAPLCPLEEREKTLHRYLCDAYRKEACSECGECSCVILATATRDAEGNVTIDTCSERRLLYTNPVLYDLIHCFHKDSAHVAAISWEHAKAVTWNHFTAMMKDGLTITFDRDIDPDTVNQHTFQVDAVITDESTSYLYTRQIPAEKIAVGENGSNAYCFTPSKLWVTDNIEASSILKNHGGTIRMTLKSDFILDHNGVAVDGNHIGGKLPSGNGSEGGDFVSWFVVKASTKTKKS